MDNKTIAKTIMDQIGSKAFFMIGAKKLTTIENGLSFKIGSGAKHPTGGKVTHVEIVLEPDDTYTFRTIRWNIRAKEMRKVLSETSGVYFDMLRGLIESETGMYVSL